MSPEANDSHKSWLFGADATMPILALADRFRALIRSETELEMGQVYPAYVPWMAVQSRRATLQSMFQHPASNDFPTLIADEKTLITLSAAVRDERHPFGAIVPADIKACIDARFLPGDFPAILGQATSSLRGTVNWLGTLLEKIINHVVPIVHRPEGWPVKRGFSTPLCYGAVFLTFEDRQGTWDRRVAEIAIDLAHEVGHHVLHTYQTADPILTSDLRAPVYSGVKQCDRPAIMSVHASVALAYMIVASTALTVSDHLDSAARGFAEARRDAMIHQQKRALREIRSTVTTTSLGERLLSEMEHQVA